MSLHETIYTLRTARGMSQLELAEALDVSRQSISKWETGAAVPELDKLVKLSDVFGITLDELVRGTAEIPRTETSPAAPPAELPRRMEPHRIAALVLLCAALVLTALLARLGFGRDALIVGLPLVAACVVLLVLPRRCLLWGFWGLWVVIFLLMEMLFDGFLHIRSSWLMLRCLSWMMIIAFVPLTIATVRRLKKR